MSTDLTAPTQQARYFKLLDPEASNFTYQILVDKKSPIVGQPHVERVCLAGPEDQTLGEWDARGASIHVAVNETNGRGREIGDVKRIRAVWRENDDPSLPPLPLAPTMVVESSPGHKHEYLLIADEWPADAKGRADFDGVIERLIKDHGGDPGCKGANHTLRVPGYHNRNYADPHVAQIVSVSGRRYTRAEILAAFPPIYKETCSASPPPIDEAMLPMEAQRARSALQYISADDRQEWLEMGMALKQSLGDDAGRPLWDEWSRTSDKFDEHDQGKVWASFKSNGISNGTLFHRAKQAGWKDDVADQAYERIIGSLREKSEPVAPGADDKKAHYLQFARPIVRYEEFGKKIKIDWLIRDVLALGHTSNTFGPPGGGKSALLSSAAVHIGADADQWMGFPVKRKAASVIFALERGALTQKRIWAESRRERFGEVPVVVCPGMINLMDSACVNTIIGTILKTEDDLGLPVELAVIDTISKGIAAGGGEENSAKDQNRVYGYFREVHEAMANWHLLHIATVGHTGKDETRGQRGSNAAEGDNDVQFQLSQNGEIRDVSIFKANEMPEGDLLRFQMTPYVSGEVDDDKRPVEIWIAGKCLQEAPKASAVKMSKNQQTMYTILYNAGPQGLTTLEWTDKAREIGLLPEKRAFASAYDLREALRSKKLVREYAGRWHVDHKSTDPV